jgi:hypothetical protein
MVRKMKSTKMEKMRKKMKTKKMKNQREMAMNMEVYSLALVAR